MQILESKTRRAAVVIATLLAVLHVLSTFDAWTQDQSSDPSVSAKTDTVLFTTVSGWNLLSLPVKQVDMTPSAVFDDDFGEDFYSVYEYGGILSGYVRADSLIHGEGFWLNSLDARTVSAVGRREKRIAPPLRVDWNLIGNPFPVPFNICDLRFTNGTETKSLIDAALAGWLVNAVYGYSEGGYFIEESALETWTGYWISLLQPDISIHYELRESSPASPHAGDEAVAGSRVLLRASLENQGSIVGTRTAEFGTETTATTGFDPAFDAPLPPISLPPKLLIGFDGPAAGHSLLLRDIRNQGSDQWDLVVASDDTGTVTVSWVSTGRAERLEFIIRDHNGQVVAESADGSFEFVQPGTSQRFTIERTVQGRGTLQRFRRSED